MRDSKMKDNTYLGPCEHPHKRKVGDTQHISFQPDNTDPFWMTEDEKHRNKK